MAMYIYNSLLLLSITQWFKFYIYTYMYTHVCIYILTRASDKFYMKSRKIDKELDTTDGKSYLFVFMLFFFLILCVLAKRKGSGKSICALCRFLLLMEVSQTEKQKVLYKF